MTKPIPKSYFKERPAPSSPDGVYRAVSNGRIGFYEGRCVDIEARRYTSDVRAGRIIAQEVSVLKDNPTFIRQEREMLAGITDGGAFHCTESRRLTKLDAREFAGKSATDKLEECPSCYRHPGFRGR